MSEIKIAIAGIGNCASSLIQGIYYYKDVNKNSGYDGKVRQPVAASTTVTFFQEIREGCDFGTDIKRRKKQTQSDQGKSSHPFEITIGQTVVITFLRQRHQMNGGDIGGKEGQADHRPF